MVQRKVKELEHRLLGRPALSRAYSWSCQAKYRQQSEYGVRERQQSKDERSHP